MSNLQAIDQQIQQFESQNRWNDAINALNQRLSLVSTQPAEQVATLERLGGIYARLNNQTESTRIAEQIVKLAPSHERAVAFLRDAYTKRHEPEKLKFLEQHVAQHRQGSGQSGQGIWGTAMGALGGAFSQLVQEAQQPGAHEAELSGDGSSAKPAVQKSSPRCRFCGAEKSSATAVCGGCGAE